MRNLFKRVTDDFSEEGGLDKRTPVSDERLLETYRDTYVILRVLEEEGKSWGDSGRLNAFSTDGMASWGVNKKIFRRASEGLIKVVAGENIATEEFTSLMFTSTAIDKLLEEEGITQTKEEKKAVTTWSRNIVSNSLKALKGTT